MAYKIYPKTLQEVILEKLDLDSALICAVVTSNRRLVQRCLDKGADVSTPKHRTFDSGDSLNHIGISAIVTTFTEDRSGIKVHITDGNTALHLASRSGNSENVKALTESGADVNIQNKFREIACHLKDVRTVEVLIVAGADVTVQDSDRRTALHLALTHYCKHEKMFKYVRDIQQIVQILINAGTDVNQQGHDGNTALHHAMTWPDNYKLVEQLLKAGAKVNIQNDFGGTVLNVAGLSNYERSVKLLIKAGLNVNIQDIEGNTALHLASTAAAKLMDLFGNLLWRG